VTDKETERSFRRQLENFGRKLRNLVARGVVALVDDERKMQTAQIHLREGEMFDGAERAQQYGFTSHPHPGAECFVVFCGAASEHPVILAVDDRRHRPRNSKPGEVVLYTDEGDTIHFKRGNIIEVTTKGDAIVKAGRTVDVAAEKSVTVKAGTSASVEAGTEVVVAAGTSVAVKAGTAVTVTATESITLAAPLINLNGNIQAVSGGGGVANFKVGKFTVKADSVSIKGDDVSLNEECE
jgi:phage baseplate assembly protein V